MSPYTRKKRIRATAQHDRANATRLEEAKAEISAVISMMAKKMIDEREGMARLSPLRWKRDAQKAIPESVDEPGNVIEIQPKAVHRFRENIESLAKIVKEKGGEPSPELIAPFRQVVAAVIVEATPAGEGYSIGLKEYLSSLVSSELSVIRMVAGGGIEPPTSGL
jgi:site-specific DNA recombinase